MSSDAPRTLDGQHLYVTTDDYITAEVAPALGDQADDYDLTAIAGEMLEQHETIRDGRVDADHSGYAPRTDVDFWEVVASHQITEEDL